MTEGGSKVDRLVDHIFRHKAGQIVSTLTRIFGPQHIETAEEVVQDAMIRALQVWPFQGVPENPVGWLVQVAKNRALDLMRRESSLQSKAEEIVRAFASDENEWSPHQSLDDELSMMFMACHPAISREGRVALTLKTVGGFGVSEIARAFLAREATVSQRLVRAKRQIRQERIRFELPSEADLSARLDSVLEVIYLLFNEGYTAHSGENLVRADLCQEAIRLCGLLIRHPATQRPKCHALAALMMFQAARLPARVGRNGEMLRLEDQDRSRWDRSLIAEGFRHFDCAIGGDEMTCYHIEAGIAVCHAAAPSYEETDWARIVELYDRLWELNPSPVIALNRAVAISRWRGAAAGILALEDIMSHPALSHYYLLPATMGELWNELGEREKAAECFRKALERSCSEPERRFLLRKLETTLVQ
jgi:RNA polymerase sigma-70 factor (ECF subfamily)